MIEHSPLEWIRDVALILFGLTAFSREIWLWTQNIAITIIFGIVMLIILFLAGFMPQFIKSQKTEKEETKKK